MTAALPRNGAGRGGGEILGRPSLPTDIFVQGADSMRRAREQGGDTHGVDRIRQVNVGPAIPPGGEGGEGGGGG